MLGGLKTKLPLGATLMFMAPAVLGGAEGALAAAAVVDAEVLPALLLGLGGGAPY